MNTTRFTVKGRLYALLAVVVLVLAAVGGIGLYGVARTDAALHQVFEGRAKALQRISTIDELVAQSHFAISDAVLDPSAAKTDAVVTATQANLATIDRLLAEYRAYPLDADERQLADRFAADWTTLRDKGLKPTMDDLKANNLSEAQWVVTQTLEPKAKLVKSETSQLRALQVESAQREYDHAQTVADTVKALVAACIVTGIAVVGALCWAMARALFSQLGGEPAYAAAIANAIAEGNLAIEVRVARNDEHSVLHAMQSMRDRLATMIGSIQEAAAIISQATSEIANGNADLSNRTEEHASGIQQTASSMEQLAATVRANADHARQANVLALQASAKAEHGNDAAVDAMARMQSLSDRSQKIRSITSVIEGIAFQTNLLALNAAVEAARAGQSGRGFAVVAQEVRALAHRSSQAAKEISGLISDVTGEVDGGADTVKKAGNTIVDMLESVKNVATLVDEISNASDEQRSGIEQINRAVAQMDQMTQHNAALVQKAASAANALSHEATALREVVSIFRVAA
ncbi:methyl-accepting chemotaxis protein [Trinickia terrae]|uniref:Methyl-accepting chemotaxis protein n=1 Tax=Trinickia terrae TaxID=2571161 RepID=A0A4U1I7L2_9BURK|nr:methyl-accepting chemotaxis protein [Trinickia terrae]TKC89406.1 methyl-accepting chemotaxis protein [Trinickia terrae]